MDWINGFILPIVKVDILIAIIFFIVFVFANGIHHLWSRKLKFFVKYKIFRKKYPEDIVKWCVEAIEKNINYCEAKKMLLLNMTPKNKIYEILYIYKKINKELKGGNKNGTKVRTSEVNRENQTKLPSI